MDSKHFLNFTAASTEVGWLLVGVNYVSRISLALVNQGCLSKYISI